MFLVLESKEMDKYLPNREELLFRIVLLFPKAYKIGLLISIALYTFS